MSERKDRERYILDRLAHDGSLSVLALSKDLGVSEVTIRASLKTLEQQGLLARTWGGAKPTSIQNVLDRVKVNERDKEKIAAAAAKLVHDHDRIMIEAGTTTSQIVRHLSGLKGVQIVTNSTLVLNSARANREIDVILTGGQFHHESESMVGPLAVAAVRKFNARIAFVGTDGFTSDRGITTQFSEGAEVISAMAERAEETWLVADSSKYGRAGFVSVLDLDGLSGLITDKNIGAESAEVLEGITPSVQIV